MDFYPQEILLRVIARHGHQRGAHAKTDLQHGRRVAPEQCGDIDRFSLILHAHHRPIVVQRVLLAFGQPPLAADKTADTAHRAAVLIKFRGDDVINHSAFCLFGCQLGKRALCKDTLV
ncbi:hypothetical protein D3C87_1545240 [compost metagenome]